MPALGQMNGLLYLSARVRSWPVVTQPGGSTWANRVSQQVADERAIFAFDASANANANGGDPYLANGRANSRTPLSSPPTSPFRRRVSIPLANFPSPPSGLRAEGGFLALFHCCNSTTSCNVLMLPRPNNYRSGHHRHPALQSTERYVRRGSTRPGDGTSPMRRAAGLAIVYGGKSWAQIRHMLASFSCCAGRPHAGLPEEAADASSEYSERSETRSKA
ncbi:hypothetical protein GGTG_02422 [Gaeumannomyces tritici R3-111a-1]|uniref:Uncharacterized protein n=1 Tax=Gaeumannomyces tritici (strain R3-111a-1) TaxID=644352 RepID=J3NMB8_GAET3|nr:hypothetical protein GGTG_02422 [Gaeumannomyces tritici R3-111a-1]EJT82449.1 hypothetical protein GGTG_02422 [Gaeumannomyces tritici R3-111a-1]